MKQRKEKHALPDGTRIHTIEELNKAIADGNRDFAIVLGGGLLSRKDIERVARRYLVFNGIDGTLITLTAKELFTKSNIGVAMQNGAFVAYGNR